LSILGGEPLSKLSDNRKVTIDFAKEVKEKFPIKNIALWTGYTIEEIKNDNSMKDILKYIDVLIDGPFIEELKDLSIPFRGSSNQRILYKGQDF
jgi:anaerobic ribonucleoside-triphosphate reductase activating protein